MTERLETRPVLRCGACGLNQFVTANGRCRRCRKNILSPEMPRRTTRTLPVALRHFGISSSGNGGGIFGKGPLLRFLRETLGWAQAEVGERVGSIKANWRAGGDHRTHRTHISRIECGVIDLSLAAASRLAQVFSVPIELFLEPIDDEVTEQLLAGFALLQPAERDVVLTQARERCGSEEQKVEKPRGAIE